MSLLEESYGDRKNLLKFRLLSGDINILEDWLQNNVKRVGVKLNLENES